MVSSPLLSRVQRYHQAIRDALLEDWDPIGVRHFPEAKDEYDSYVAPIYKLLIRRAPKHEIFDYLWWLETQHMGLTGDRQATEAFAERLLTLRQELDADPN